MKRSNTYLITILLVSTFYLAQAQNELPETTGAFYAISVKNLDASINWYKTHLNFEEVSRSENEQRKGALLSRPGAVLELAEFEDATSLDEIKPGIESHEVFGLFKLGFLTANIEETFKYLEKSGVEIFFPIVNLPDGKRTFGIKDLDGNIVQFYGS